MSYFTRDEILMGRDKLVPITQGQSDNLDLLIQALDKVRAAYGKPMIVSSGYRPATINQSIGGAKMSAHMSCQAVDIKDDDGLFANWCLNHLTVLKESGILGMEDPRYTMIISKDGERVGGWVHLDIRGASSHNIVFIPYVGKIKLKVV